MKKNFRSTLSAAATEIGSDKKAVLALFSGLVFAVGFISGGVVGTLFLAAVSVGVATHYPEDLSLFTDEGLNALLPAFKSWATSL